MGTYRERVEARRRGAEYIAQDKHIGNMTILAKTFKHPRPDVDLRKVRGRVKRAQARCSPEKYADLMRRYEEFAAQVQKLREV